MTDTSQKLREAFEAHMRKNGLTDRFFERNEYGYFNEIVDSTWTGWKACAEALALPTAAPEMPLSMNQFGRLVELTREHLTDNTFVYKATSKAGDTCHFGVESAAKAWAKGGTVETIKLREFKLHTSALTATPVGEREAFEAWLGITPCGAAHDFGWAAWQARAALSAGDAVDARRYRWLRDEAWAGYNQGKGFPHVFTIDGAGNRRTMLAEDALDAIDAAMRKGQL